MDTNDNNSQPVNTAAPVPANAATTNPAPAPNVGGAPAGPDLGGLISAGANAGPSAQNVAATLAPQMIQHGEDEIAAAQKAADAPATPPPAGPHARLLSMVAGLAQGLGAAGKALATHGREGGAEDVAAYQAQQEQQRERQQQLAMEQKDQNVRLHMQSAQASFDGAQNLFTAASMPLKLDQMSLENEATRLAMKQQGVDLAGKTAAFVQQFGVRPEEYNEPASQNPQGAKALLDFNTQKLDAFEKMLPKNDPTVATARQQLDAAAKNPNSTGQDFASALLPVERQVTLTGQVQESQVRQGEAAKNAPLTDAQVAQSNAGLLTRWQVMNPGAKSLPSGFTLPAGATPQDFDRVDKLMQQTENAAGIQTQRDYQNGIIASGNTDAIAQNLVNGNIDPSQLSKRSSSYNAVIAAADAYSMKTTGQHFDLAQAQSDYKYATNPATQNTLKYLNSVIPNMKDLVKQSDALGRTQFPPLNKPEMWARLNVGNPQVAAYEATITEVSDQIAKILQGGGSGNSTSDAKLKQAQQLFNTGFTPQQIKAVVGELGTLLQSRQDAMVGTNRYLIRQQQRLAASNSNSAATQNTTQAVASPSGSAASRLHANLTDFAHQYSGRNGSIYSDDGKTWFDARGNQVQ